MRLLIGKKTFIDKCLDEVYCLNPKFLDYIWESGMMSILYNGIDLAKRNHEKLVSEIYYIINTNNLNYYRVVNRRILKIFKFICKVYGHYDENKFKNALMPINDTNLAIYSDDLKTISKKLIIIVKDIV